MSAARFVNVITPLTTIPIVFGLIVGVWGCVDIITRQYGIDIHAIFPLITTQSGFTAPLVLFVVAFFAFSRGQKIRDIKNNRTAEEKTKYEPLSVIEKLSFLGVGLGIITVPYSLDFSGVEFWVAGFIVVMFFVCRKIFK